MAIKKSEIYRSLWKSCDELRGGMDASQYKDYVLTLLFVKYVSDKYAGKPNALIRIPKGGAFGDIVKLIGKTDIGDGINKVLGKLAEVEDGYLKGMVDIADFNNEEKLGKGKDMQDCLSTLVAIFKDLDFRNHRAADDDLLGGAYEYLMRHFATESGKSKGQFYTPAEVSRVMAKVIGITAKTNQDQTVYDPTCGSGSLLLKAANESPRGLSIYAQEKDVATTALARMNMVLHDNVTAEFADVGNSTLSNPKFFEEDRQGKQQLKRFHFVVANPPFSTKSWKTGFEPTNDAFKRFEYGIPPAKNGDYAFLLHIIASLNSRRGKGAVILPHGVLFRGNAEKHIRTKIVKSGFIKGIIGLPANLFYGTSIAACIIVLDKENANARKGIFMINAEKGYIKDGNKNRLRERDIHEIVDVFTKRRPIDGYSRMVPLDEIAGDKNAYNLNLPRYIDGGDEIDLHDLTAHLQGGIPKRDVDRLADYWKVFGSIRKKLFKSNSNPKYLTAQLPSEQMRGLVLESNEYQKYAADVDSVFAAWKRRHHERLQTIKPDNKNGKNGSNPKEIIRNLSEDLLVDFADVPLINKYAMYQHLMDYWAESMQDDVYAIVGDGWKAAAQPRLAIIADDGKAKETPDIVIGSGRVKKKYKTDLIPPALIVRRFYPGEQTAIDELQTKAGIVRQKIDELTEQHSDEEGSLDDITTDAGKLTKSKVKQRIKEIKGDAEFENDISFLEVSLLLLDEESDIAKQIKFAQGELDKAVLDHYATLNVRQIKELVVDDKWLNWLDDAVKGEIERVAQTLVARVGILHDRYIHPLPTLVKKVGKLSTKVDSHLKKMGVTCK